MEDKTVMMHHFVIQCYRTATEHTPGNRRAWQALAMANYDLSTRLGVEQAQLEQKEAKIKQVGLRCGPLKSASHHELIESFLYFPHQMLYSENLTDQSTLKQSLASLTQRRSILQRSIEQLAAPSVRGYINSISISSDGNLQVSSSPPVSFRLS